MERSSTDAHGRDEQHFNCHHLLFIAHQLHFHRLCAHLKRDSIAIGWDSQGRNQERTNVPNSIAYGSPRKDTALHIADTTCHIDFTFIACANFIHLRRCKLLKTGRGMCSSIID